MTARSWRDLAISLGGLGVLVVLQTVTRDGRVAAAGQVPDLSSYQAQIQALEARVKKLEDRLEKPLSVKAPFAVTNDAGQTVFRIKAIAGPELTLGSDTAPVLRVSDAGGRASLQVQQGSAQAGISVTAKSAVVIAGDANRYARLVAGDAIAFEAFAGNDRWANLGVAGDGTRLKLTDGGKQIFRVQSSGGPELMLGAEGSPSLKAVATSESTLLSLEQGKTTVAMRAAANGEARFAAASPAGNRVFLTAENSGDAAVEVGSGGGPAGANWAQLVIDKNGPRVKIGRGGKPTAELGAPEGKQTGLRIYDDKGLALSAGLGTVGRAGLSLWRNDTEMVAGLMSNETGEGVLQMYRPGGQLAAELGRMESGKATALRIYDTSGAIAVGAGIDTEGDAAVRVAKQGKPVASITAYKNGFASVDVLTDGKRVISLNTTDKAGEGVVEVRSKTEATMAALGSDNGQGSLDLFRAGEKLAAQISAPSGRGTALRIFDNAGAVAVGAGIDVAGAAAVRVGKDGKYIAGMTAYPTGNGSMDIFSVDGRSVVSLNNADKPGQGLVAVRNSSGQTVAALQLGSNGTGGNVTLYDSAARGVFSAGNASDGWGEACVTRQNGKTHCLGIGMPGMGVGDAALSAQPATLNLRAPYCAAARNSRQP